MPIKFVYNVCAITHYTGKDQANGMSKTFCLSRNFKIHIFMKKTVQTFSELHTCEELNIVRNKPIYT